MALYKITIDAGSPYGTSLKLRVACRSRDGARRIGSKRIPPVTIASGEVFETDDPRTVAAMDGLEIGDGVRVRKVASTTARRLDYDTHREPYRDAIKRSR